MNYCFWIGWACFVAGMEIYNAPNFGIGLAIGGGVLIVINIVKTMSKCL